MWVEAPSFSQLCRAFACVSAIMAGCGSTTKPTSRHDPLPATAVASESADSATPVLTPTGAEGAATFVSCSEDDCSRICAKLLKCRVGPWDQEGDCIDACGMSNEDETSGATYSCVAKSVDCDQVHRCAS